MIGERYRWEEFRQGDPRWVKLVTAAGDQVGAWDKLDRYYLPLRPDLTFGARSLPPIAPPCPSPST